ncbi:MAG TPA: glycosyltransferase [Bacteroidales bacterium]|nr:glycosyltransferase [Bacteroidales bacterium]
MNQNGGILEWFSGSDSGNNKFSIIIPSWNNLALLKLCVESIEKNSSFKHQIIIHVNEGTDGTLQWVQSKGFDYTYSKINVGVCWAVNACRALVKTDYIAFLNDDMYMLPGWDSALWDEIEAIGHKYFFLSSTTIEPRKSPHPGILSPYDFGNTSGSFREEALLQQFMEIKATDWSGATWPPNIVHRDIWDLIGGYSVEYFPGLYSDPDFSVKLYEAGVRYFKGVDQSRVYHFGSRSTNRIKMNHGSKQFLNKWGITSASFCKYYLRRGQKFLGPVEVDTNHLKARMARLKSVLKRVLWAFGGNGRTKGPFSG